jgi:hypothetical protein
VTVCAGHVQCGPGRWQGRRACAAVELLRACDQRCFSRQTAADADDVWGDIRDDGDEAESAAAAAREAAVAAAVDRLVLGSSQPTRGGRVTDALLQRRVGRAGQGGTGQRRRQEEQGKVHASAARGTSFAGRVADGAAFAAGVGHQDCGQGQEQGQGQEEEVRCAAVNSHSARTLHVELPVPR